MAKKLREDSTLYKAKKEKKDEFYTRIEDIELEIRHYKDHFKGKVVLCNCDDPYESNFFKYFAMNFNHLGLKKLIATCYGTSPIVYTQLNLFGTEEVVGTEEGSGKTAYKLEITEVKDENNDGSIDLADIELLIKNDKNVLSKLKGNGDFRSEECKKALEECDIVVTNPPFSLFRDFLAVITEYNKDFIIIGNTNALTYREVFKLFKEDRIRTGYTNFNVGMFFAVPDSYEKYTKIENGVKYARVSTSCWFTSLPVNKHNDNIPLYKIYTPEEYPKFENFDAINIGTYTDIPCDYDGIMGVPITFLDKYNPNQFEIIGLGISNSGLEVGVQPYKPEHKKYRKEVQKRGAVDGDLYLMVDGVVTVPYARILIRRKN